MRRPATTIIRIIIQGITITIQGIAGATGGMITVTTMDGTNTEENIGDINVFKRDDMTKAIF